MILRYATPFPGESDGAAPLLHMARARYMGENSTSNRSSEHVYELLQKRVAYQRNDETDFKLDLCFTF
ncbi:hypothetical protein ALC60_07951 [Trachymyrmex zeteki]|uniref:Uncharacterized protein n=1 Tax=Mycetomoellerius zeteki TaxID=64791 RepID=A0A151WYC1_9HYME|nr:hypothetical protein ALC60_07951 [Trachymyrmex zeteki]